MKPDCSIPGCTSPAQARSWCAAHWARWKKYGEPLAGQPVRHPYRGATCTVDGCSRVAKSRGWCSAHWTRWRRWGDPLGEPPKQTPATCRVDGCERQSHSHQLCNAHYSRWKRYGDPLAGGPHRAHDTATRESQFWERVDKNGPTPTNVPALGPCWLWRGAPNPKGYGAFSVGGRNRSAHRLAYELVLGPAPPGLQLHHRCLTPACVNPAHLEPLTPAAHGRASWKSHCKRGHELTPDNVYVTRSCRLCALERASGRT